MADQFKNLKVQLEQEKWPDEYLFKFIVPSNNKTIALVNQLFHEDKAVIKMRPSSNGKYTSISVQQLMNNADEVIEIYENASQIKNVITL